jgi:hypothetical protein
VCLVCSDILEDILPPSLRGLNFIEMDVQVIGRKKMCWIYTMIFVVLCIMISFMKMTNKMQLCRRIYYSLAALHVLSNIFAHHQEHLNCIYSFWYYMHMLLPVEFQLSQDTHRQQHTYVIPEAVIQFRCS